ncbi:MAG: hypothetical protein ABUJ93_04145, partial [Hyphomicrobium sp.]
GALNGKKNNPDFRPAKNVRKGYADDGNACQAGLDNGDPPQQQGLPDDTCFPDTCPYMDGRMGDGDWDIEGYKLANNLLLPGVPNSASRYEVYLNELATDEFRTASPGGETGEPQCYSGGDLSDDPDRRLLFIAVLDCQAHNVSEENMGNSGPPVPVTAFMKMFLTKPVDQGPDQNIYAELVDVIEPGNTTSNVVRDIVQLYR